MKQSIESDEAAKLSFNAWQLIRVALLPFILMLCFGALQGTLEAGAQGISPSLQVFLNLQVSGVSQPVQITNAGDGSGRLFVVEQIGRIRIIKNGILESTPFLNISNRVSCCGERGLLSVSFPTGYTSKGYFYVNYTDLNGNTVVARYHVTVNPDVADPNSEEVVLTVTQPFANHNGGQLAFGPDGLLYIGMGDGGSGGDPNNYAQNLNDLPGNQKLLGKLLRIDVESGINPYAIPLSNPILNGTRSEIWALGLRNPWRFSFDRLTGDMYIGDVGQDSFEEVDFQPSSSTGGENYGWRIMEGFHCFNPTQCVSTGLTLPVVEYDHSQGCAITGGMVYRGQDFPLMQGIYFYGDFCTGRIWGLKYNGTVWQNVLFLDSTLSITTFGEDETGELYVADYANGQIYRIIASNSSLAANFGPQGLYLYRNATWSQLTPASANRMASYGNKLAANFPGLGLYEYDGSAWTELTSNSGAENLVGVSDKLYADYGMFGLWMYSAGTWTQIAAADPDKMAANGTNLLATFSGSGLYQYNGTTWTQLASTSSVDSMLAISGKVYVDFGNLGLWQYDGGWVNLSPASPNKLQAFNGMLAANFPGLGLYEYAGITWNQLTPNDSVQNLLGIADSLYADFDLLGFYRYNGAWSQLSSANANRLGFYGQRLVVNFPAYGLYAYDASGWAQLTANSGVTDMVGVDLP